MNQLVQKLLTPWTSNMNDNNIDESDTMIVPSSCDNQVQVRNSGKYATSQQLEARSKQTFVLKKKMLRCVLNQTYEFHTMQAQSACLSGLLEAVVLRTSRQ